MSLGIFRSTKNPPPAGMDSAMWHALSRSATCRYDGPTEDEPSFIAPELARLRAELTRIHHEEPQLPPARLALDTALQALRLATVHQRTVTTDTALPIQAARAARHRLQDPLAPHLRAHGARATKDLTSARGHLAQTEQAAEARNLELRHLNATLTDRMHVVARAAMPRLHEYLGLLNAQRARTGQPPLANLPADLPDHLVLDAARSPGEPAAD